MAPAEADASGLPDDVGEPAGRPKDGSTEVSEDGTTDDDTSYAWKVSILLFGMLAERLGRRSIELAVAEGSTALDVIERFGLESWLDEGLSVAIDGQIGDASRVLRDGAEIALLPPVSGG